MQAPNFQRIIKHTPNFQRIIKRTPNVQRKIKYTLKFQRKWKQVISGSERFLMGVEFKMIGNCLVLKQREREAHRFTQVHVGLGFVQCRFHKTKEVINAFLIGS